MSATLPVFRSRRSFRLIGLFIGLLLCTACAPDTHPLFTVIVPQSTISGHAPQTMAGSAWEQLTFPVAAGDVQGFGIVPDHPEMIFACSGHLQTSDAGIDVRPQPIILWRTTDAGAHWTRYAPAVGPAFGCDFSFAPDDPQQMAFYVGQASPVGRPCADDSAYRSTDGGATWHSLPLPRLSAPGGSSVWCQLQMTRNHLFLSASFEVPVQPSQSPLSPQSIQTTLLERSDDDGATWVRADGGLGGDSLFSPPRIGPGDWLTVTVLHLSPQPTGESPTMLWTSVDAGRTWRPVSALPEGAGTFLLTAPPVNGVAWPDATHPFYALEHEQIPSNLYREQALMSGDGRRWTLLPPLPVAGVSAEHPGILQALGELPDGRLAVWGPDPKVGLMPTGNDGVVSKFWLWLWSPTAQRWQVYPSPLSFTATEGCGLCWAAVSAASANGATYLYMYHHGLPGIFRIRLPWRAE